MSDLYVLGSFALLTLLNNEPGAARVEALLLQAQDGEVTATMSLINLGEVAYIVERRWGVDKARTTLAYLESIPLVVAAVQRERVLAAAHVKANFPLAHADAFAVALAQELDATLLTSDPEFHSVAGSVAIEWLTAGEA